MMQQQSQSGDQLETAATRGCDRELINYVLEVIQEIKSAKQQCQVNSINERLKRTYGHVYPAVLRLTDKELMIELDMAVKEGILSKKFRQNDSSSSSSVTAASQIQLASSSSPRVIRLPRLDVLNGNEKLTSAASLPENDPKPLLQLVIKTIAAINKQSFSPNHKSNSSNDHDSNTCTIDELLKHMNEKNK